MPENPSSRGPRPFLLQTLQLVLSMALVFGLYRLVRLPMEGMSRVGFANASFLLSSVLAGVKTWKFWMWLALAGVFFATNWRVKGWRGYLEGGRLHWVIWAVVGVLAWTTSLHPYNFFYDQAHLVDRAIILSLAALTLWRPAFFPLFFWAAWCCYAQWYHPAFKDPELTNRKMVMDMAYVLFACGLLRPWLTRLPAFTAQALPLAFLCANMISYWMPGLAKLEIGSNWLDWTLHDDLTHLMVSTYLHGWNLLWDQEGAIRLHQALQPLGLPLKLYTVFIELALLAAFWNRRWFVLLAAGRALLHVGIMVLSGDTFWNWIVIQSAIVAAFWKPQPQEQASSSGTSNLFTPTATLATAIYILLTAHSHKASTLGWFDTQLTERYNLYAIMEDGRRLYIVPTFFEPYDFAFIQSQFHFLQYGGSTEGPKVLTRTFGASHDAQSARLMREAKTPDEARAVIESHGHASLEPKVDINRPQEFENFIRAWMRNHAARQNSGLVKTLHFLSPPLHAYVYSTRPEKETYLGEQPVRAVEVEFERIYFTGEDFVEMDRRTLKTIPISIVAAP
ncbi:MAG: hypothetical protein LDL31_01465 [Prosthecobacter sp.]|nr:hypothetical protein [Prosthecobacter sp.]